MSAPSEDERWNHELRAPRLHRVPAALASVAIYCASVAACAWLASFGPSAELNQSASLFEATLAMVYPTAILMGPTFLAMSAYRRVKERADGRVAARPQGF